MEKEVKSFFKKNRIVVYAVVAFALVVISAVLFTGVEKCDSFECFQDSMNSCSRASYVNEEPEASWGYVIEGVKDNRCVVNVNLLQAKQGELGIDRIVGFDMDCAYPRGVGTYPEKDLSKCHGRLKEELQGVVIEKLHTYVLENLIDIEDSLEGLL